MPFSDFIGNERIAASLRRLLAEDRLPQTLLFAGPAGVGKATLARFLAAAAQCPVAPADDFCGRCSSCLRIFASDLSRDEHRRLLDERAKAPAAQRNDNPLIISTHPDFLIFPPDGPLRLISVEQARQLRSAARFTPSEGKRRIFLIDEADRANDEAANSLLKTLEEPSPALTIVLTAQNPFELLPTIRSRTVPFYFSPLTTSEMERFFELRLPLEPAQRMRLAAWAQGSTGRALQLDPEDYAERREAMLAIVRAGLGVASTAELIGRTESICRKSSIRTEELTGMLYGLLSDLLHLQHGSGRLVNADLRENLRELADRASFEWTEEALRALDEIDEYRRRNVQRQIAFEALAVRLRRAWARPTGGRGGAARGG